MELREQALIGGAALAALAQALTSLVGVSWFPEVVSNFGPGLDHKNKPPKDGRKKTAAFGEGVDKNAEMRWIFVRNNRVFWVGCIKKDIFVYRFGSYEMIK